MRFGISRVDILVAFVERRREANCSR